MTREKPTPMGCFLWVVALCVVIIGWLVVGLVQACHAHDHEHPELTPWYQSLTSGKGPCCDGSDAKHLSDVDWESKDGHYRVRIPGNPDDSTSPKEWVDVPDEAVVKGPNRDGRTLVWPMYYDGHPAVRCFMPGSMS